MLRDNLLVSRPPLLGEEGKVSEFCVEQQILKARAHVLVFVSLTYL